MWRVCRGKPGAARPHCKAEAGEACASCGDQTHRLASGVAVNGGHAVSLAVRRVAAAVDLGGGDRCEGVGGGGVRGDRIRTAGRAGSLGWHKRGGQAAQARRAQQRGAGAGSAGRRANPASLLTRQAVGVMACKGGQGMGEGRLREGVRLGTARLGQTADGPGWRRGMQLSTAPELGRGAGAPG